MGDHLQHEWLSGSRLCRHTSPVKEGYAADSVNHMSEQPLGIYLSLPRRRLRVTLFLLSLLSSSIFGVNPSLIKISFFEKVHVCLFFCTAIWQVICEHFGNLVWSFCSKHRIQYCWFLFKRASSLAMGLVESIYSSVSINVPVISTFQIPMFLASSLLRKQLCQLRHIYWKTNPLARFSKEKEKDKPLVISEANDRYKLKQWWCSRFPMPSPPWRKCGKIDRFLRVMNELLLAG